jgi:SynChlorMet cassette radical SAM/SPASM protein ScmF
MIMGPTPAQPPVFPLRSIYFYPTESCNLKCIHCWISPAHAPDSAAYERQNRGNLTVEEMERVVEEAKPLGLLSVKITGGEPFLNPRLFDFLDMFHRHGLGMSFETNGTLLTAETVARLRQYKTGIMATSLDGSTAENHERIRGVSGSFEAALRGIRLLVNGGFSVQSIFCLMDLTKEDLLPTMRLAHSLGVSFFEINPMSGMGGSGNRPCKGLPVEELLELEHKIENELSRQFPGMRLDLYLPPALKSISEIGRHRCGSCRLLNICGILSDGDVSICGIGRKCKSLIIGNVREQGIAYLWENSPLFKQIREKVPFALEGVCGRCMFRYSCLGFCRAEVMNDFDGVTAPFPMCEEAYQKGLFPKSRIVETHLSRVKPAGVAA